MKLPGSKITIPIIILWCFITRLPQLCSPNLLLDGDECLVGIMAKHIYECRELPMFFWGQQYGFTLIECLFILPFYLVLGFNTLAVKLAMLCLWTVGVVWLYKLLCLFSRGSGILPFLLTLLFVALPAWAIWSMKARGGYLTAFVLSNMLLYFLYHPVYSKKTGTYIAAGILLALVYEAQRFWLGGLVFLIAYSLFHERSKTKVIALSVSAVTCFLLFYLYKEHLAEYYTEGVKIPALKDAVSRLARLPVYLYTSFHGNYYFSFVHSASFSSKLLAVVTSVCVVFLFAAGLFYLLFKRKGNMLFICTAIFLPLCFIFTLAFSEVHGRYLLPLTGFMVISLQVYLGRCRSVKVPAIIISVCIAVGIPSLISFYHYELIDNRRQNILLLLKYFEQNKVRYVYSLEPMVSWEIVFYSREKIITRMPGCKSRYLPYDTLVNNALLSDAKTAFISRYWEGDEYHLRNKKRLGMYIVGLSPAYAELKKDFCMP